MINRILRAIAALIEGLEATPRAEYVPIILSPLGGI